MTQTLSLHWTQSALWVSAMLLIGLAPNVAQAEDAPPAQTPEAQWELSPLRLAPEFQVPGVTSDDAIAQSRRRTTTRRRTYRRRYYRYRRSPQPYYHSHITITPRPQDPGPRVTTQRRRAPWQGASLTLRTTALSFDDNTVTGGSLDGEDMAGFGVGLRMNLDQHWAVEFAVDLAGGRGDLYDVAIMPVTASLIARLFPESRLDLFGLAGGGVYFTEYDYHAQIPNDAYMLAGAHVGGGAELKLGHFLLTGDARYLILQNAPSAIRVAERPTTEPTTTSGQALTSSKAAPARLVREDTEESWRNALQVTVGIGYRW
ncbi:MAG: hypothetical protein AAFX99_25690 [Myxococcota bacterium]